MFLRDFKPATPNISSPEIKAGSGTSVGVGGTTTAELTLSTSNAHEFVRAAPVTSQKEVDPLAQKELVKLPAPSRINQLLNQSANQGIQ